VASTEEHDTIDVSCTPVGKFAAVDYRV